MIFFNRYSLLVNPPLWRSIIVLGLQVARWPSVEFIGRCSICWYEAEWGQPGWQHSVCAIRRCQSLQHTAAQACMNYSKVVHLGATPKQARTRSHPLTYRPSLKRSSKQARKNIESLSDWQNVAEEIKQASIPLNYWRIVLQATKKKLTSKWFIRTA